MRDGKGILLMQELKATQARVGSTDLGRPIQYPKVLYGGLTLFRGSLISLSDRSARPRRSRSPGGCW